ncbi:MULTISPECIES: cytochrome C oxidase subunit IV family protein [Saliphagus]|uniref:Cytochrome C oxidase subunit IV family protein n=1 Tax=Saliphagus infecundisoli TaxID=1849069 RepID=A0ABD5QEK3_9EURY|nr:MULTISPECIES: cytochrome C oxidase subunit IV family protein [Saliphagus]
MASVRTYAIIYVALLALGTVQFVFFEGDTGMSYQVAMAGVLVLSVAKAGLIIGYYQHLIDEPRSLTYLLGGAVFMVFLLTIAAGFSIQ